MKYITPNASFIPVATGLIVEIPLDKMGDFNARMNGALMKACENIRRDTQPEEKLFTCALCNKEFVSDPEFTEEQRVQEQKHYFGEIPPEERVSVCEDCWMKIHPERN